MKKGGWEELESVQSSWLIDGVLGWLLDLVVSKDMKGAWVGEGGPENGGYDSHALPLPASEKGKDLSMQLIRPRVLRKRKAGNPDRSEMNQFISNCVQVF